MVLYQLATGHYVSRAISLAAELGIADYLGEGPRDAGSLAAATGTHAPSLRRVLRLLVSVGVLTEEADGRFGLTALGNCLRREAPGSFRATALLFGGPLVLNAWGALLHCVRTGEPAFRHLYGTADPFEYFEQHPEEAAIFDEAMASFARQAATAVAAAYDFSAMSQVVDVGGGNGALLIGILQAFPSLHGVVFDLPRTTEAARRQIAASGLDGRCTAVGGDFFQSVPAGGDAYILKHVIHDWDDERATAILRTCRRAMNGRGKLLIVEAVYPPRIEESYSGRMFASNDVNMLVATGGRQRSEPEFHALLAAAGFRLARIVATQALSSVIEGAPE
jgi:hypothetical protein